MTLLQSLPAEEYKCDGNAALYFKLVRSIGDLQDESTTFHPDMCHQVFGESETVFGYKKLRINCYYTACSLSCFISMQFCEKITKHKIEGLEADDVMGMLTKDLIPLESLSTNVDKFASQVSEDKNFRPYGPLKHAYTVEDKGTTRRFEIYTPNVNTPGFREYHDRLQVFIMFFIDGASFIDMDDDRWGFYLLFEKFTDFDGGCRYAIAGYMTFYKYFAYPCKLRPRISQFLILPPFQRAGHGVSLLQVFYNDCIADSNVLDITVEDPVDVFQRMRDFVDCQRLADLPEFSPKNLRLGFTQEMVSVARETFRINRRQVRRCYEILRLRCTDQSSSEEYRDYRLDVKRRLSIPYLRPTRDLVKASRALDSSEMEAVVSSLSRQQRCEQLNIEYDQLLEDYQRVLSRLSTVLSPSNGYTNGHSNGDCH